MATFDLASLYEHRSSGKVQVLATEPDSDGWIPVRVVEGGHYLLASAGNVAPVPPPITSIHLADVDNRDLSSRFYERLYKERPNELHLGVGAQLVYRRVDG